MKQVLAQNIDTALSYLQTFDGVDVSKPEGTYMLFLDCTAYLKAHNLTLCELLNHGYEHGVYWQSGELFNTPNAIRMNFAIPHSRMIEALERLKPYVFTK